MYVNCEGNAKLVRKYFSFFFRSCITKRSQSGSQRDDSSAKHLASHCHKSFGENGQGSKSVVTRKDESLVQQYERSTLSNEWNQKSRPCMEEPIQGGRKWTKLLLILKDFRKWSLFPFEGIMSLFVAEWNFRLSSARLQNSFQHSQRGKKSIRIQITCWPKLQWREIGFSTFLSSSFDPFNLLSYFKDVQLSYRQISLYEIHFSNLTALI